MNSKFVKNVLSLWGDAGQQWLDSIPQTISDLEEKWNIKVGKPFPLSANYVAQATQDDGTEVVIKIGFPTDQEFLSELKTLPQFNSKGMVLQLKQDLENTAMLLERLHPGESVSSLTDEKAIEVMAQVMKNFWQPSTYSVSSTNFKWSHGFKKLKEKYHGSTGPLPQDLILSAESLYLELTGHDQPTYLLHGDLHQGNVLSATREPWLAIDPKGIVGPRERETAPLLVYPEGFVMESSNPKEVLKTRIAILSEVLSLKKERIAAWGFAHTVLQVTWSHLDHETVDTEKLAIADILRAFI